MKQIKVLRQSLNFSQDDMAFTLGVKRSMIVRAENGKGGLNIKGGKQLINLDTYIKESEKTEDFPLAGNDDADLLKAFEWQKNLCFLKAFPLRNKLKKLETDYVVHQKSLKILELMELNKELFPPTWLADLKSRLYAKLIKCSPLKRAELKRKLAGVEAEESYILEEIKKLKVKSEKHVEEVNVEENGSKEINVSGDSKKTTENFRPEIVRNPIIHTVNTASAFSISKKELSHPSPLTLLNQANDNYGSGKDSLLLNITASGSCMHGYG